MNLPGLAMLLVALTADRPPPPAAIYAAHREKHRAEIARTFKYVCTWVRKVGWSELASRRFITPGRSVQESLFGTGDAVVVNFGTTLGSLEDGQTIPPRTCLTFTSTPKRAYTRHPQAVRTICNDF